MILGAAALATRRGGLRSVEQGPRLRGCDRAAGRGARSCPSPMRVSGVRPLPAGASLGRSGRGATRVGDLECGLLRPCPHHSSRDRVRGASPVEAGAPLPPSDAPRLSGDRRRRADGLRDACDRAPRAAPAPSSAQPREQLPEELAAEPRHVAQLLGLQRSQLRCPFCANGFAASPRWKKKDARSAAPG